MKKIHNLIHFIPYILVAILVAPKAWNKLAGSGDPLPFFNGINILGLGVGFTQIIMGLFLFTALIGLFIKKTELISSVMLSLYMVSALILVGAHSLPLFVISLLVLGNMLGHNSFCSKCSVENTNKA